MEENHIEVERQGYLGILRLNRPRALNALDHAMILALSDGLAALVADPSVAHIAIASTSSRAFCAGGDMRAIRQRVLDREIASALSFFRNEFTLNQAIADCRKPIVALVDGICMGGGLGLSVHARYRVVAPTATFAMPETAIGYFPDVGATFFLNALPGRTGLWLGLTGARLTGSEACTVGLGTHLAEAPQFAAILSGLARSSDTEVVLRENSEAAAAPKILDPALDQAFQADGLRAIERALLTIADRNARAAIAHKALMSHSPHAIALAARLLADGVSKTLEQCLHNEYSALQTAFAHPDFAEGIRAVLVDKDQAPRWVR